MDSPLALVVLLNVPSGCAYISLGGRAYKKYKVSILFFLPPLTYRLSRHSRRGVFL